MIHVAFAALLATSTPCAATPGDAETTRPDTAPASTPRACTRIAAGTPVQLELAEAISSATATVGTVVRFRLAAPVTCGEQTVLPAGTPVRAEVIRAVPASRWSQPGALTIVARSIEAAAEIPVRALYMNASAPPAMPSNAQRFWGVAPRGLDMEYAAGHRAEARIVVDIPLPMAPTHASNGSLP